MRMTPTDDTRNALIRAHADWRHRRFEPLTEAELDEHIEDVWGPQRRAETDPALPLLDGVDIDAESGLFADAAWANRVLCAVVIGAAAAVAVIVSL